MKFMALTIVQWCLRYMKNNEFERPDLYLYEKNDESEYLDFSYFYEPEYEPCPCCGAENPVNIFTCPVCSWQYDDEAQKNPDLQSKQNHGISLYEAKLNFGVFGNAYPPYLKIDKNKCPTK